MPSKNRTLFQACHVHGKNIIQKACYRPYNKHYHYSNDEQEVTTETDIPQAFFWENFHSNPEGYYS